MTKKKIGKMLKHFRLFDLNMGIQQFAKLLGILPSHLCNVEQGRRFDETPKAFNFRSVGDCKEAIGGYRENNLGRRAGQSDKTRQTFRERENYEN